MSDRPYTDDDLRAEAARQHALSVEDPDYMGIGERMDGSFIDSTVIDPDPETGTEPLTGTTWDQLAPHQFGEAQRAIDGLLNSAADTSDWAINLGADGLERSSHEITLDNADGAFVRLHIAFHPSMPEHDRLQFTAGVKQAIAHAI